MKRMLSIVTGQRLPNFIPLNEPATRPDSVQFLFTPSDPAMKKGWEELEPALRIALPDVRIEPPEVIEDAYDGAEIYRLCEEIVNRFPDDDWSLNATGGTKLMSGAAMDLFFRYGYPVLYVETPRRRTIQVRKDWIVEPLPFEGAIDLATYFSLYNLSVRTDAPRSSQELAIFNSLSLLDWKAWSSVHLNAGAELIAEYDIAAIKDYQLTVFECKRLSGVRAGTDDEIVRDLFKLYQVQQQLGGPFGRSFWIFSGRAELRPVDQARIQQFGITVVRGADIARLDTDPESFRLPARLPKSPAGKPSPAS